MASQQYDAVILGAGAAGLMCAIEAGKRGRRILLLERSERIGKKILVSGGGRCNFTNRQAAAENFISSNPHFAKSALARYRPDAFVALVEKHHIPYHEKKLGQLFCDRSASDIVAMLEEECRSAGVEIRTGTNIVDVGRGPAAGTNPGGFTVRAESGSFSSTRLVVATGGLSIPKIGATSFGYDLARQFRLRMVPARAALVPLVFSRADQRRWCDLAGLSAEVIARAGKRSFLEKMLFTHRGISGPAILQISSYWDGKGIISLDLAPGLDLNAFLRQRGHRNEPGWKSLLRDILPRRLADRWLEMHPLPGTSDRAFAEAERQIHSWEIRPATTEGFGKAEVTVGGVHTGELSSTTMESRKVPGLFFIGEVVDVTGQLGGFNFQWAWASGFCAGQVL
ncbi:MAG TPA: NAD(P)/FAD-dependent oxidoreductase [Terriglobales bacterium]|nr:NAD(P)/FAD-dependent oxidoreductase [Terriglobales bacterium]